MEGKSDDDDYHEVDQALNDLAFSSEEKGDMFSVIGAILHLGNVAFRDRAGAADGSEIEPGSASADELARVSELLGVVTLDSLSVR